MKLPRPAGVFACLLCLILACSPCCAFAQAHALPLDNSPGFAPLPEDQYAEYLEQLEAIG